MSTLADRAKGTAFAVLYEQRCNPASAQPTCKAKPEAEKPKLRTVWAGLQPLENVAPCFNTPITTSTQAARTSRIRGRGLL